MSKSKSEPKYKHLDALERKHRNDEFPNLPLGDRRANRANYAEMEQLEKHMVRRNDDQGRFNVFHRRRCLNKPAKFRWHNWKREVKYEYEKHLRRMMSNGN